MNEKKINTQKGAKNLRPDAVMPMRIARWMAQAGLCSRREAERWILIGRVSVNGIPLVTPALDVGPEDRVEVDGVVISASQKPRLWRYYKPTGLMTTHRDPGGRPTVFEHLPPTLPRVISVGRLDLTSEGLLLLTNNGALARFLEHPQQAFKRTYRVRIYGKILREHIAQLEQGMTVEGVRYRPIHVQPETPQRDRPLARNQWVSLTLEEGKNREIRKIMGALGFQVNRLIRTHYGPFSLNTLKPGEVEEVEHHEFLRA